MLYNRFPGLFSALGGFVALVFSYIGQIASSSTPLAPSVAAEPVVTAAARVIEI